MSTHCDDDTTEIWKPLLIGLLIVGGLFVGFGIFLFYWLHHGGFPSNIDKAGQFGDSFGPLTSLFTGLAFGGLIVSLILQRRELQASLRELRHSVEAQQQIAHGAAHERLYHHNLEWLRYLADHPELRPHFYDNKPLDGLTELERFRVLCAAEMLAGFLELIVLQSRELGPVFPFWERFLRDIYRTSPSLREYFAAHGQWYVPDLMRCLKNES